MPSGDSHGSRIPGRPRVSGPDPAVARSASSRRASGTTGEALRDAVCQLLPRPGQEVERVDAHGAGVVDARSPSPGCRPRSPTSRPPRAGRPPRSAPHSAYVGSAPARQTTGWPSYAASTSSTPRWARRRRRRCRRRRTGWWRRSRGRCARRPCPGWRGRPARRPARRAAPRTARRSAVRASCGCGVRSGSVSPRFGNSLTPVSGRLRRAISASRSRDRLVDPAAQRAVVERRRDPAGSSIRPELRPAGRGQSSVSCSTAYEPPAGSATRATCDSAISSAGGVARDPAAERVGHAERGVERQHRHRVGAADAGGEGRDGGAQHVHPGVVLAHHRPAGDGVLALLVGVGLAQLEHARPQPARGPQLGDGRELLVGGGVPELDQAGRVVAAAMPPSVSIAEVRRAGGHRVAELLGVGRTQVVHRRGVDDDRQRAGVARQLGNLARSVGERTRSACLESPRSVAPNGSAPRLVPSAGSVSPAQVTKACAAAVGRPARPARPARGRGARPRAGCRGRRPARPRATGTWRRSSRSTSAASLAVLASVTSRWARMSQSAARVGRPPVASSSSRSAVPSGGTTIPSSVVRPSLSHAASSGSSSASRPALRSTAAVAFSQSARRGRPRARPGRASPARAPARPARRGRPRPRSSRVSRRRVSWCERYEGRRSRPPSVMFPTADGC